MNHAESYRSKVFTVTSADARIRREDDLMAYAQTPDGRFLTIAQRCSRPHHRCQGWWKPAAAASSCFGHATSEDGTQVHGWTSTRNLERKFINETIGILRPAPGAGRYGARTLPGARGAVCCGQVDLVEILGSTLNIERLAMATIAPYAALVAAAASDGVAITLNSGFRSYPEQRHLHEGYTRKTAKFQPSGQARLLLASERPGV